MAGQGEMDIFGRLESVPERDDLLADIARCSRDICSYMGT